MSVARMPKDHALKANTESGGEIPYLLKTDFRNSEI
jgi:hypothetical protein